MFIYIHILSYYKLFLYFNLCLSVKLDSLSCSFTSISFLTKWSLVDIVQHDIPYFNHRHNRMPYLHGGCHINSRTQIKVKEQLVVRKYMDVNEHERLSFTLRHKLK
jgi:hypothetical protein